MELEDKLRVAQQLADERAKSDNLYAIKLVEKIVFGLVALILTTVCAAVIGLVILRR